MWPLVQQRASAQVNVWDKVTRMLGMNGNSVRVGFQESIGCAWIGSLPGLLVSMEYVCKFMLAIDGGRGTGLQWNSQIRSGFV